jgi:hypothetical protein
MRYLKDLLLTDTYLLRGHVNTGGQRLSTFLNTTPKRYVEMNEATLLCRNSAGPVAIRRLQVRIDEILLAHEMDEAGDETLRILAERAKDEAQLAIHFGGPLPLEVAGKASRRVVEREAAGVHDFMVIIDPAIRGLPDWAAHESALLNGLPYLIANRGRMALIGW